MKTIKEKILKESVSIVSDHIRYLINRTTTKAKNTLEELLSKKPSKMMKQRPWTIIFKLVELKIKLVDNRVKLADLKDRIQKYQDLEKQLEDKIKIEGGTTLCWSEG